MSKKCVNSVTKHLLDLLFGNVYLVFGLVVSLFGMVYLVKGGCIWSLSPVAVNVKAINDIFTCCSKCLELEVSRCS